MISTIVDYSVRTLLAVAGIGNIALASACGKEDFWVKVMALLSGVIMLLLSVFFTGFMVHLANHSKDRRILFGEINDRLKEIKDAVCPPQKNQKQEVKNNNEKP
ncbi:MAG: hypothetical protein PHY02_06350 [Phycisphaerae bacterium]|nr:hypothetical protein [Phycisphaerae bacterium]